MVVRGTADATAAQAAAIVAALDPAAVLWVGGRQRRAMWAHLGASLDAVVVDLHEGIDADVLGLAHGVVRGGGALILRIPEAPVPAPQLVVWPHGPADVGHRFWARLEDRLAGHPAVVPPEAMVRPEHTTRGTDDQARAVAALSACFRDPRPGTVVLTARRGRGKSSALGLALADLGADAAVTGPHVAAVAEILAFAPDRGFVIPEDLVGTTPSPSVIVVDEAAGLAVPLLQRLVQAHPRARFAFATTTEGYEGTGRGFSLRFVPWLRARRRVEAVSVETPIRWPVGDPLEAWATDVLALDAAPASRIVGGPVVTEPVPSEALQADRRLLDDVFGLLVHAHYRTTPADLQRLLDAPNLILYATRWGRTVVAVDLVAREGGLSPEVCAGVARGHRLRGHALPETLISHLGHPAAGTLTMIRSVRLAVHPDLRRRGIATALVEAVHRAHAPDLFGTLFGATAAIVGMRRRQGYALVRLGSSGGRTAEPSVVMIRPRSDAAARLVAQARQTLARNLPLQIALLAADGRALPDGLGDVLCEDLPAPPPLADAAARAAVVRFAWGPGTFEANVFAIRQWLVGRDLSRLPEPERIVVADRVLASTSWQQAADTASLTVPSAMRALRRGIRGLLAEEGAEGSDVAGRECDDSTR